MLVCSRHFSSPDEHGVANSGKSVMSPCNVKADENDLVYWRFLPGAILGE
jgi:hypothetical protein